MKKSWKNNWVWISLVIIAAIIAYVFAWEYSSEASEIESRYDQFYTAMVVQNYSKAYKLMSPVFQEEYDIDAFQDRFSFASDSWLALNSERSLRIRGNKAWLCPSSSGFFMEGPVYEWVKIDGQWYLSGEYELYVD